MYRPIFTTNQALNHSTAVGTHYLGELFTGFVKISRVTLVGLSGLAWPGTPLCIQTVTQYIQFHSIAELSVWGAVGNGELPAGLVCMGPNKHFLDKHFVVRRS